MNIAKRLEKIERDMNAIAKEIAQHSGVDPKQATQIGIYAAQVCETAAIITGATREAQGKKGAKKRIRGKVRAALGYLYP
jgi:hypothetical protein